MATARILTRPSSPHPSAAGRLRVLVVGQDSPGGIGTFIQQVMGDAWLGERIDREHLPAPIPDNSRPGSLTMPNIRHALTNAFRVFRRARKADVVHLNMAAAPMLPLLRALTFSLAGRAAGARVILHLHTGRIAPALRSRGYRRVFRVMARVVDMVVVVSQPSEVAVHAARIAAPVRRIENGIDVRPFGTGPKEDPPSLLFVGTVCARKGLLDLRDALVVLRSGGGELPVHVDIAGDGKQEGPGAFEEMRDAFTSAGLTQVHFLGEVASDEVARLLARSSIFCLPSHWEGFPLSVLEAMASETVVVATTVGDIPLILDDGRAGVLVPPHDPRGLADAIGKLVANPEERERLGRLGRERVEQVFRSDRVMRALFDAYVSVTSTPPA